MQIDTKDGLIEVVTVKMFPSMKRMIMQAVEHHPNRWASPTHFCRAAILNFFEQLEKEGFIFRGDE